MVNLPEQGPMSVEKLDTFIAVETVTCGHGREMGYNLAFGIAAHIDDSSNCRQTGLPYGVDEELTSRDALSYAALDLLRGASARMDALLLTSTDGGQL